MHYRMVLLWRGTSVCQSANNCFSQRVIVIRWRPAGSAYTRSISQNAISYFSRTIFHAACNLTRYGRHPRLTRNHYWYASATHDFSFSYVLWPTDHVLNNNNWQFFNFLFLYTTSLEGNAVVFWPPSAMCICIPLYSL